jgi:hypothetical protein
MFAKTDVFEGLNAIEQFMNTMAVAVPLVLWVLFLSSLRAAEVKMRWFYAVVIVHFAPVPLMLVENNQRIAWQFFRFSLLRWLALIIGIPHHFNEKGKRLLPRIGLTLLAIGVNAAFYWWIMNNAT